VLDSIDTRLEKILIPHGEETVPHGVCGVCKAERCQVDAIVEEQECYRVLPDRCIGCGLCVTDCSVECIRLVRRPESEIARPSADAEAWNRERARNRGVDYSALK
jgi:Na+-translocating ferredoxin:NAD+ oxidoreductase RNF subunit RnfB